MRRTRPLQQGRVAGRSAGKPDAVPCTATALAPTGVCTHHMLLDHEPGRAQSRGKCRMRRRRPHRHHPTRPQRCPRNPQSRRPVQPVVVRPQQRFRSVVDIEQDGIESVSRCLEQVTHVAHMNRHAGIIERLTGRRTQPLPIPRHDLGHQFRHQQRQRCAWKTAPAGPARRPPPPPRRRGRWPQAPLPA